METAVPDEEMDSGTGLSQGLADLTPFAEAAAALAGAPGVAPPAAANPVNDDAFVLWMPEAFVRDLLESALLQHFEVIRAKLGLQPMCGLRPKQGWNGWLR